MVEVTCCAKLGVKARKVVNRAKKRKAKNRMAKNPNQRGLWEPKQPSPELLGPKS